MKLILFVFLFTLLASSYAVTLKAKAKAVLKALSEKSVSGNTYRSVFKNLLTLTEGPEYAEVFQILQKVRGEIAAVLDLEQQAATSEQNAYDAQHDAYEQAITDIGNEIELTKQDLQAKTEERDGVQKIITDAGTAINDAVSARDQQIQTREQNRQTNQANVQSIEEAKAQCDLALSLLQQAADIDLPSGTATFLETKRKKLHASLLEVGKKVRKITTNSPALPFIESLISIAQNTINEAQFDEVISLVESLKASLEAEKQGILQKDAEDEQSTNSIVANLDATIETQESVLRTNQAALISLSASIEIDETKIDSLSVTLENASDALNQLDEAHSKKAARYLARIERFTLDIEAIDKATEYLNSQMEPLSTEN